MWCVCMVGVGGRGTDGVCVVYMCVWCVWWSDVWVVWVVYLCVVWVVYVCVPGWCVGVTVCVDNVCVRRLCAYVCMLYVCVCGGWCMCVLRDGIWV